jgi:lipid-A-disaccharide synthase
VAGITIGIVAGEASGDALAATLIRAVRAQNSDIRFVGIAGPQMEAAGCEAWYSVERLAVRGFVEVIAHLPQLFRLRRQLRSRLLAARVPLFIGVDAPDFNFGLERKLKRRGVRTIHFVSPSVWAWRRQRLRKIGRAVDRMLALFPFEPRRSTKRTASRTFTSGIRWPPTRHARYSPRDAELPSR